jgi:hypothetical protein
MLRVIGGIIKRAGWRVFLGDYDATTPIRRGKNRPILVRAPTPNSTLNSLKLPLYHIKNCLKIAQDIKQLTKTPFN